VLPMPLYVDAVGARVAFDAIGHGPDLVFLHAGIADRSMWAPQLEAFSTRFRCIAPDLRGFGETPVGSEPYSRRDDVLAILDDLGVASAAIVGCSLGGAVALDLAVEHPDRVDKIVLVGVAPPGLDYASDPFLEDLGRAHQEAICNGDHREVGRIVARAYLDGPRRPEGSSPEWLREQVIEWSLAISQIDDWGEHVELDPPASQRLEEVRTPTLVIVGAEDIDSVLEGCRTVAAEIPEAALVELAGAAHLPNLERRAEFDSVLTAFLS